MAHPRLANFVEWSGLPGWRLREIDGALRGGDRARERMKLPRAAARAAKTPARVLRRENPEAYDRAIWIARLAKPSRSASRALAAMGMAARR